jgi:hypothetical protein
MKLKKRKPFFKLELVGLGKIIVEADDIEFVSSKPTSSNERALRAASRQGGEVSEKLKGKYPIDLVRLFCVDRLVPAARQREQSSGVYAAFIEWTERKGEQVPPSRRRFAEAMQRLGYRKLHSNVNWWVGVKLRPRNS